MNRKPFVLLATIPLKPGCEVEYLSLVGPVNDAMRHEPTFVNTVLHRAADDPALFMLHETWLDQKDFFAVQMKRPYRAAYEARLPALLRAPWTMQVFEPLRSDFVFRANSGESPPGQEQPDRSPVLLHQG